MCSKTKMKLQRLHLCEISKQVSFASSESGGKSLRYFSRRGKRDEDDSRADREEYFFSTTAECVSCRPGSGTKTAKLLLETGEWTFYYCYRCRGWFRKHYRIAHLEIPIRDKMLIKSLNWFYMSEMQFMGIAQEMNTSVRRALEKLKGLFSFST